MRIGIDGVNAGAGRTGMGVMVLQTLRVMAREHPEHEYLVYFPRGQEPGELAELGEVTSQITLRVLPKVPYPIWEQLLLPAATRRDRLDVLWCPYNTAPLVLRVPLLVTVHDVIYMGGRWTDPPSWYKRFGKLYRRVIVPHATRRAAVIATVSDFAKAAIEDAFPWSRGKLRTVYLGVERVPSTSAEGWRAMADRLGVRGSFFLGHCSSEPRKNFRGLVEAYRRFLEECPAGPELVIFGYKDFDGSPDDQWMAAREVKATVLGFVTDEEKHALFAHCVAFVFPSLAEGFGLPVVEAFDHAVPVITSATTSLGEVAGEAAIKVQPDDSAQIAEAMRAVVDDQAFAAQMARRGAQRAERFRWSETSRQLIALLRSAARVSR